MEPDFTGWVMEIQPIDKEDVFGQILVESQRGKIVDKYWVTIIDETLVFRQDGEARRQVDFATLETKQQLQI